MYASYQFTIMLCTPVKGLTAIKNNEITGIVTNIPADAYIPLFSIFPHPQSCCRIAASTCQVVDCRHFTSINLPVIYCHSSFAIAVIPISLHDLQIFLNTRVFYFGGHISNSCRDIRPYRIKGRLSFRLHFGALLVLGILRILGDRLCHRSPRSCIPMNIMVGSIAASCQDNKRRCYAQAINKALGCASWLYTALRRLPGGLPRYRRSLLHRGQGDSILANLGWLLLLLW